jgi:hypothetical protein
VAHPEEHLSNPSPVTKADDARLKLRVNSRSETQLEK